MIQFKWFWILLIALLLEGLMSNGCLEHERIALLQLKSFFNHPRSLSNWVDAKGSDCCQWDRVKCNITSGRVIRLSLNSVRPLRIWGSRHWYLNASLFLPFQELKSLNLSQNQIDGFVDTKGLNNLETLDLSGNYLKNNFLLHVGRLSSLKTLNLGYNQFQGSIHIQELNGLTNLRSLDLSGNEIESFQYFQGRGSPRQLMINLEVLDLSANQLQNSIFAYISVLSNLKSLNLGYNQLQGSTDIKELNNLAKLKKLDMSVNQIENLRSFQGKDSERQLRLMNLEELDLSNNLLDVSILAQLSGLFNLKSLNLRKNRLIGSTNMKELQVLKNLEELDLSYNDLHDFLVPKETGSFKKLRTAYLEGVFTNRTVSLLQVVKTFSAVKTLYLGYGNYYLNNTISTQELNLLSNVQELFLDFSNLSNNFLESVGAFTSLKTLMLSNCGLSNTLPTKGWCDLRNLQNLDLSRNALQGTFPSCLDNLTYLQFLEISNNHIEIPASFMSFSNHSHLKFLFIDQNNLVGKPTFQTQTPIPKLQLQLLGMSNCTKKGLFGKLASFLYHQYDLRFLDLSYNNFSGKLPSWLLENNTRLQQVFLMGNSFAGPLQLPEHTNVNMLDIDMSQNKIEGQLPMNICSTFPNLEVLFLFQNALEGYVPPCFGGLKFLSRLDLSYNNFSGGIPGEIGESISLFSLRLSANNLSGKIVPTIFSSNALYELYLDGNNFDGEIPLIDISIVGSPAIWDLDFSDNHLSGKLPKWIGNMSGLQTLDLSNNHLDGLIPPEFCNLDGLQFLDLSQNNFSGSVPSCFNSPLIQYIHLSRNRLGGPLPHALYNSISLVTLDLSPNNLTGKIPDWIGTLSALSVLILKANHFEAEIPTQLCQLNSLSIVDLSQNKLFGSIPSCLSDLTLAPNDDKSLQGVPNFAYSIPVFQDFKFKSRSDSGENSPTSFVEEQVQFTTKKGLYKYSGNILEYMSGIDFSCNRLTGQIPPEIGNLSQLHALNLSHNNLTGFIPSTFSNLKQIESLDLSNNKLSGRIPIQLPELNFLGIFNVSYNNLSGSIPFEAQFATFDESSYLQNPFLCGPPLDKDCTKSNSSPTVPNASGGEEEGGLVDEFVFIVSFLVSYGMVLMVIASVLYINSCWRRAWFYFIEQCINSCHFFIVDHFPKFSMFRRS